jgi:hypothetical protein
MTPQDLKQAQEDFLERAKRCMLEDDKLAPLSFIFTTRDKIERLHELKMGIGFLNLEDLPQYDKLAAWDVVVLIQPRFLNWEQRFGVIHRTFKWDQQKMIEDLLAQAMALDVDDPFMRVTRPLMMSIGIDEQDVSNKAVEQIAEAASAFAIVHVSESYYMPQPKPGEHRRGSLANDPRSEEAIVCSLETRDFSRLLITKIIRRDGKRDEGKVIGFGDVLDSDKQGAKITGRMLGLLKPLPSRPNAS